MNTTFVSKPGTKNKQLFLKQVDTVNSIDSRDFRENYFEKKIPLVIKDLAKSWPAYQKWNWDYFKQILGNENVGIYNNTKSDAHCPVNRADKFTSFGNYIDMICNGPSEWRIFLFNIFNHAPHLTHDFTWPNQLMKGFVKHAPMLFVGGKGSVTHMHFDMDLSHILHTQFVGKKHVLLFPYEEQYKLYRKPFEVLSLADFTNYYDAEKSKVDLKKFPALAQANGYSLTLEHGDTLFMPGGYWHQMEYEDSGFAMSLRSLQESFTGKLWALWNLLGMRNIDTLLKKTMPLQWYSWKEKKLFENAQKATQLESYHNQRVSTHRQPIFHTEAYK